jgi:Cu(I)/Ag(I) efflux system membrane fusion protein
MSAVVRVAIATLIAATWGCGDPASEPVMMQSGGTRLAVAVSPAAPRVGVNALWIELRDASGAPVSGAQVEARVVMHAMGTMPGMGGPARVREEAAGRYRADFDLAMGGTWQVEISATPPDGAATRVEGSLTVGTAGVRLEGAESNAGAEAAPTAHEAHPGEFRFPSARLQRVGVKTGKAERKTLRTTIRAVGRVTAEETTLEDVSLKVRGWVGQIHADAVGDPVEAGSVLFTVYSPELYAAQEEYVQALGSQERARETSSPDRADYLARAARNRLRLWDVADAEIERIARSREPMQHVPIRAPVSGYVVEKNLVEGSAFQAGERLYRIAPLSQVWVEAEVYEYELPLVREGQDATVTLPYASERSFEARIDYVYPTLDPRTRTARLRLAIPNADLALRPDMFANVQIHVERGERLVVPQSAVLYAGERSFVFRALGEGRFRPQEVRVGLRAGEDVEIAEGLEAGDAIVTSATFLIASESRLRAALEQW